MKELTYERKTNKSTNNFNCHAGNIRILTICKDVSYALQENEQTNAKLYQRYGGENCT